MKNKYQVSSDMEHISGYPLLALKLVQRLDSAALDIPCWFPNLKQSACSLSAKFGKDLETCLRGRLKSLKWPLSLPDRLTLW